MGPAVTPGVVGVDVGGTFTDFALVGPEGLSIHKRATSAPDPSIAVLAGLAELDAAAELTVAHGTTVATNALLERKGARTAFVTTGGFGDTLQLGRGERTDLYALEPRGRVVLVPEALTFEVEERVGADGAVLRAPGGDHLRDLAGRVRASGAEAVAVSLLFSYLRPDHERAVGAALQAAGVPYVSLSVDVLPEMREYERASTVVVNAYVAPVVGRYIGRLAAAAAPRELFLMGSHAGVLAPDEAARLPVSTVLSGPAAGVVGALAVASRAGRTRILTFDMGGTSTDVALCDDDVPFTASTVLSGLPIRRPAVDVQTVGAGGGSYLWLDEGGALRVGPESAGSAPGPAAYGRGGDRPTVTDAHVVLGRLPADRRLAGGLRLDARAAHDALAPIAGALGLTVEAVALGAIAVADAAMERALRSVSVERGHDPAAFSLVAFGGAGPLHACALADLLGVLEVLVPTAAGTLSALGLATAPPVADASRSVLRAPGAPTPDLEATFSELEVGAASSLPGSGRARLERFVDARYAGQSWELTVPWPGSAGAAGDAFGDAHDRRFGYRRPGVAVELVTVRVRASRPSAVSLPLASVGSGEAPRRCRLVLEDGRTVSAPAWARGALAPGERVAGPGVILQEDATTYVPDGWVAETLAWGDLSLRRDPSRRTGQAPARAL